MTRAGGGMGLRPRAREDLRRHPPARKQSEATPSMSDMTPEKWERVKRLFELAQDLDPSEREALLERECGDDDALRQEVARLLAHQEDSGFDKPILNLREAFEEAERAPSFREGEVLAGRYELRGLLGRGGMGEVYRAFDRELRETVALKLILPQVASNPDALARLRREIQLARRIAHPNICRLYHLEYHRDPQGETHAFLTMELIEGQTLADHLGENGKMSPDEALPIVKQLASALDAAHREGVIHRDLKPSNVILTRSGDGQSRRAVITDFGLAREFSAQTELAQSLMTETGHMLGTPAYMAPEQLRGQPVTPATDVYALGLIMYEMLTGTRPFKAKTLLDSALRKLQGVDRSPRLVEPNLHASWETAISRCLHSEPDRRPPCAGEVADFLAGRPHRLFQWARPDRLREFLSQRLYLTAGLSILVLGAAMALLFWPFRLSNQGQFVNGPVVQGGLPEMQQLATPPTWASTGRLSPDNQLASFIGAEGEEWMLSLIDLRREETRILLKRPQRLIDHVWSSRGQQLACLMRGQDGARLEIVSADDGGLLSSFDSLDAGVGEAPELAAASLVRWVDSGIFLFADSHLWKMNPETGVTTRVTGNDFAARIPRSVDLRADGESIVFTSGADKNNDIWTANADGSDAYRLTSGGEVTERYPVWLRRGNAWDVVFTSNQGGQFNLWRQPVAGGTPQFLTASLPVDIAHATATDGSFLIYSSLNESSELWWRGENGFVQPVTPRSSLGQFSPSLSDKGLVAFQRSRSEYAVGFSRLDRDIFIGRWQNGRIDNAERKVEWAYAPRLSPDSQWMAYFQVSPNPQLQVHHIAKKQPITISYRVAVAFRPEPPEDWGEEYVWGPAGEVLYFVTVGDFKEVKLRSVKPAAPDTPRTLAEDSKVLFYTPRVSSDGRWIAFAAGRWERPEPWELRIVATDSDFREIVIPTKGKPYCAGWWRGRLVALVDDPVDDGQRREVLLIDLHGRQELLTTLHDAFDRLFVLDRDRGVLYFVSQEENIHNLLALDLGTPAVREITSNVEPNVFFSGLTTGPSGELLFAKQEVKRALRKLSLRP